MKNDLIEQEINGKALSAPRVTLVDIEANTSEDKMHFSDCSVHNEPYMPNGACDCK
jgi:hypothetical protein